MRTRFLIFLLTSLIVAEPSPKPVQQAAQGVLASFQGYGPRHLTPLLLEIARNGHSLTREQMSQLQAIGFNFNGLLVNRTLDTRAEAVGLDQSYDNGYFRFHYTTTGTHAVSTADTNSNGIPDYVDLMAAVFNEVSTIQLDSMGYVEPPGDGWLPPANDNGGSDHYDVYIRSLSSNTYGYVQPEYYANNNTGNNEHSTVQEVNAMTSYMAMRNNYNGFPNSELENIQVTTAHEFYHAIQFGYDGWEKSWLMEASAVWMEEGVYDDINDCYQYMSTWFNTPHIALDKESSHWYGSFIFFEYIYEHLGGAASIRRVWEKSIGHDSYYGDYSHLAINEALSTVGSSFRDALKKMVVANRILKPVTIPDIYSYEEAEAYPVTGPRTFQTITFIPDSTFTINSTNLNRYASQYIKVNTSDPISATLTNTSGPATDLDLLAILKHTNGSYTVWSGSPINVDPADLDWLYFVVVSQDTAGSDWNYQLVIENGQLDTSGQPHVPNQFRVSSAYPNPFNSTIHLRVQNDMAKKLQIAILDLRGRVVTTIYEGTLPKGNYLFSWDGKTRRGTPVASGTYFLYVTSDHQEKWQKITLLK
ncbi:MAG: MXAN_6640 family putative metalloprotease [Fidelibacterota bacterium]